MDCYASQTNSVPSLKQKFVLNLELGHKCLMQTFSFPSNYDLMLPKVVFFLILTRQCDDETEVLISWY